MEKRKREAGEIHFRRWLLQGEAEWADAELALRKEGRGTEDGLRRRIKDLEAESEARRLTIEAAEKAEQAVRDELRNAKVAEAELRADGKSTEAALRTEIGEAVQRASKAESARAEGKGVEDLLRRNHRELHRQRDAAVSQAMDLDLRRFLAQATAALGALCTIVLAGAWLWAAQLPASVVAETPPAVAAPDPRDCCSAWNIDPLLGVIGVQN